MSKRQQLSKRRFLNSKQGLLFLVFAVVLWALSALSNSYTTTVPVKVILNPDSEAFIPLSNSVEVPARVSSTGFSVLYRRFFPRKIELSISKLPITDLENPAVPTAVLQKAYVDKYSNSNRILSFVAESADMPITLATRKSFAPVLLQLPLAKGYQLVSPLKYDVDSVSAFGSKAVLSQLNQAVFKLNSKDEIKSYFSLQAKMVDSIANLAYWSSELIQVSGKVDRYSDVSYELPLTRINVPESISIALTPNQVEVKFAAPLSILRAFNVADLRAEVDFQKSESGQIPIQILGLPSEAKQLSILPPSVSYFVVE